jgi:hypothetical protein
MLEDLRGRFRLLQETAASLRQQQQVQFNLLQQAMSGNQSQLQSTSPRGHSLPHPMKLNSTGGGGVFATWVAAIRAKLAVDGQAIGDSAAQFYYVLLRLDQGAQEKVLPKLKHARASGNYDYNKIIEEIAGILDKDDALL